MDDLIHSSPLPFQENDARQSFIEAGWWESISTNTVSAHWLSTGEYRMDAGYYAAEAATAMRVVNDCGFQTAPLKNLTNDIFVLDRFRRIYATNTDAGWPYLSASETLEFRPVSDRYIAKDHAPKSATKHFAKPGWILVSASGSVGRLVISTNRLSKYFLTHDLIRIIPRSKPSVGYLYAYLSSWVGQALIVKDQYGAAIKHLEPHHLAGVPVPLVSDADQQRIDSDIMRAFTLRDEANKLLDEADDLLHQLLGLPKFDDELVPYYKLPDNDTDLPQIPHPKAFEINSLSLSERFDASFHVPTGTTAITLLGKGLYPVDPLRKLAKKIFIPNRFKRIYVPKEYGIPFLQGSHLTQLRPYDLKYISKIANIRNIDQCLIEPGYVLVSRSGTIGTISLASKAKKGWSASEHILRIDPSEQANSGYITAFLMSSYGQYQILSKVYGGVVDEITEDDTGSIWIPNPPPEIQARIGEKVIAAFEMNDEAVALEEKAINTLENLLLHRDAI